MADIEYSGEARQDDAHPDQGGATFGGIVNVIGALTSLALVAGVGIWGYNLLIRDVSGVPVVQALEGPMRIAPDDPGGEAADYQGLAVNAVAAQGAASPTADRLMLAPRPVVLADDDGPVAGAGPAAAVSDLGADAPAATMSSSIAALVEELTRGSEPISGEPALPVEHVEAVAARVARPELPAGPADAAMPVPRPDPAVADAPGLRRSLRPQSRPARIVLASASADGSAPMAATGLESAAVAGLDVDPDTLPVGTRLAQLGAYDTPEMARAEWDRLFVRFADYLDGKQRVIQEASSGGRTFYRLRAMGFDDLSDARRFCSALVAENADCIPVTLR